jgi:GDPmannose 4,6-dehydratase
MAEKVALVTGISGQDGSYLSELLVEEGYKVVGLLRRQSVAENQTTRLTSPKLKDGLELIYSDLLDESSIFKIINKYKPNEIYNLAAMSHVRVSFDVPAFTIKTNSIGVLNLLEAIRNFSPESKFYQASSSEMFGNSIDEDGCQRLTTPMNPVSPYGCSKLLAYKLNSHYRNAYNLHLTSGILFNHESPRRGSNFITNKVVKGAVLIKMGLEKNLFLGNLDSKRDWGHSYDYVRAIYKIMQYETPRDWIVATGTTRSVRELCDYVFKKLEMDYQEKIKFDPKFLRDEELKYLKGDPTETKTLLEWEPKYTFEQMIDEMIEHWYSVIKINAGLDR